jgi:hypothetical protein
MMLIDLLKYGALGLGLALAILVYRLLRSEQRREVSREPILKAIRLYMLFSLLLAGSGFAIEYFSKWNSQADRENALALGDRASAGPCAAMFQVARLS